MTPEALGAIAKGSLPKGYRDPFNLKTGKPVTFKESGENTENLRHENAALRQTLNIVQSLIHNLPRSKTADQIDKLITETVR